MKRPILLTLALLFASAAVHAELRLEVDLSKRQLVALNGDDEVARYDIAIGKDRYPTPTGAFKIRKLIWNPSWKPPDSKWAKGKKATPPGHKDNPMKVVKIFFSEPDYYIHGTADIDSLGSNESHGCIRMSPDDVAQLGQLVMEHGGKSMPEPWWRRIFRRKTTKVVYLSRPVEISIRS